jgi:hypothetical protein
LFTSPGTPGSVTVTAACGSIQRAVKVTVFDTPPTVVTPASASPNPVTGTTAVLTVLGADCGGEASLTYTWSATALPMGAPAPKFSANGTNAAKQSTVTFGAVGTYGLTATMVDSGGLSVTSDVTVTVSPTFTSIVVSPATVNMSFTTQQFTAVGQDQFGSPLAAQPSFTWAASSGKITAAGLFTPATSPSIVTITAASGSIQGTATAIVNDAPTVAKAANANPNPVTGTTTTLTVLGADDGGEPNLTYTWSTAALPNGAPAPTFIANGTNAAKSSTVTFGAFGSYSFTATITDAGGLSVTSSVAVTVAQGLTSITVSPATALVIGLSTQQFTAVGYDQFGETMSPEPVFTWTVTAGTNTAAGAISAGGLFTAPASSGTVIVTAASGFVHGTAQATVTPFLNLQDPSLLALTSNLFARDGQINRADMIEILQSVVAEGSVVSATDVSDLQTIVSDASALHMPGYVQTLASDVVDGNTANAQYQGQSLGNLLAGDAASNLTELVDKWFLGMDHPAPGTFGADQGDPYDHLVSCAGSLFSANGPQYTDVRQGDLGDCYFVSALGSIARVSAADIEHMFIDNGDGTWTIRFYKESDGTPDYVTVDRVLPANSSGNLMYSDAGDSPTASSNILWTALAEKAYAQWNETGNEGRNGNNDYASISGGSPGDVDAQALGRASTDYGPGDGGWSLTGSDKQALISALASNMAVAGCTIDTPAPSTKLAGWHCYNIISYDSSSDTFTLFNPWNTDQPNPLTWADVEANMNGFAVANPLPTPPVISSPAPAVGDAIVSLRLASMVGGPSMAASIGVHGDTVAPGRGSASGDSHAALAWFASLGSDWQWSGSDRSGASCRPSAGLTPALVDAVFDPAASQHKKLPGVADPPLDATVQVALAENFTTGTRLVL